MRRPILAVTVVLLVFLVVACSGRPPRHAAGPPAAATTLPKGSQPVKLDPAQFTTEIDNPYWPMAPGNRWRYRETDRGQVRRVEVVVTDQTKTIMGIQARVIHDKVTATDGALVEDTLDWYAQDAKGNIWYLGEDTKEYENGKVTSTEGSWQAGVDGAQPGIMLPASPHPGLGYRQEYLEGQAEDAATVLSLDMRVKVPFGTFDHVLVTEDFTPLEPEIVEHKFYARGVGPLLTVNVRGGAGREELLRFDRAR